LHIALLLWKFKKKFNPLLGTSNSTKIIQINEGDMPSPSEESHGHDVGPHI
jgi:hypothetical protein